MYSSPNRLVHCWLILCAGVLFVGSTAEGASPALGSISPRGYERGKDATMVLSGARLDDAKDLFFYTPGFTLKKLEVVNANQLKATVGIAPTCSLGEHALRVRTASGISELQSFWIGHLPIIQEKEPNSEFANPQKIALNHTVMGVVDLEDVDYYAVDLKKGQRLSAEIEGMRLASAFFDPYIAILDAKRFELATNDDSPLYGQDGACSIVAPADGTYYIQVRDSAYQGNGACIYRLHVGTFPGPQAVVPAGGKAGEEIEVTFLGDPRGPFKQKIKIPNTPGAKFGIHAQDQDGMTPSALPFRVSEVGNVVELEPNDTHATATRAPAFPIAFNGVIEKPGDVDCFRFKGVKGQTFDVHCYARRIGSMLDPVMTLSVADGGALVANDDAIGPDSYFRYTLPEDREYVLTITDHLGKGGPTYSYRVEFQPVVPTATVSIPKVNIFSQERQTISVPRGGRMATLFSVARANFGGELSMGGVGLPAGLTLQTEGVAGNLDIVPVVFEAAPTAPVGGSLAGLELKHVDPKHPKIDTRFNQTVELMTGGPGQSVYWKQDVDRLAIAVCDEVPYSIEIVEPKSPLVQNGSMPLKIIARRKPGFTAAITVYPLFNPPGVGAAPAVTIPANGNEVIMPLNAAPNAQVRKWKTAVIAVSDAGKGPMWVSSQLATIEVAAPFVAINIERAAVEQGKDTEMFCKVQQLTPFEGKAKVRLMGLPFKVLAPEMEITKDTKDFVFKVTTDKTSPAGQHRNLFCQVVIPKNGEEVVGSTGGSELRIDVPIVKTTPPPPPVKPATPVVAQPTPAAPPKRLSRLEQLRKEQEEREKTGTPAPTPPTKK
ncbi:MAG: PPC domain-containing protein [Gemmataceae bacterium]